MMKNEPRLSILLSFRNQEAEIEPTLTTLFGLKSIHFELIIVDDASADNTNDLIQTSLEQNEHEQTLFLEHKQPAGRGSCLNEALQQAGAPIIWMPRSIQSIDEKSLQKSIRNLENGGAPCLIQSHSLPANLAKWPAFIKKGRLPKNGQMLWNTEHIPSTDYFINPFLERYQGLEWLIRLGMDAVEKKASFFTAVASKRAEESSNREKQELLFALLRRPGTSHRGRKKLAETVVDLPIDREKNKLLENDHELLEEAAKLKMQGQLSAALEYVDIILKRKPDSPEAKHLKIKILERKRRFVEASELKHELQISTKAKNIHSKLRADDIKTSLIIPTALYGKPALENCLISVNERCSARQMELIIIDNASLDDTHTYLQELQERNFFNIKIITNKQNRGFAASVNQGLKIAGGEYACIMHNDVELAGPSLSQLEQLMDSHPRYALIGPLADSTLNPDQLSSNKDAYDDQIVDTDYLDSFLMMFRTDCAIRMDETYELAFFDDIDFAFEARRAGYKTGIAPEISVKHHYGTTTLALDMDTGSRQYWKNIAYFNEKWDVQPFSGDDLQSKSDLEQLLALDEWANPMYPDPAIQTKFNEFFTEELKTHILNAAYDNETNMRLVHLMMVVDKRDVMRQLERRIEEVELPEEFIYEIIRFYFEHNVYSRCRHYLNRLSDTQVSMKSELYRLAILIDEKKMDEAIPLLSNLLNKLPANPMLYKLAGDIHSFESNNEEAASFYRLAHQINPFDYTEKELHLKV
jgi:GT2 family glycosyltransferase